MISKTFRKQVVAALFATVSAMAFGHGDDQPQYGGTVSTAGDLGFELVAQPNGATLYVQDHGKPLSTEALKGTLTVLNGADKSQATLSPAGAGKLQASGVKLSPGSKAVAAVTLTGGKTLTVRFAVK